MKLALEAFALAGRARRRRSGEHYLLLLADFHVNNHSHCICLDPDHLINGIGNYITHCGFVLWNLQLTVTTFGISITNSECAS